MEPSTTPGWPCLLPAVPSRLDVWQALSRQAPSALGAPALRWETAWAASEGAGVRIALLDTGLHGGIGDLVGASIEARDFTGQRGGAAEHGTYAATLLVAQGRERLRGLAPRAHLLAARVVDAGGVASADAVVEALDWAATRGAHLVLAPLADAFDAPAVARAIERCVEAGARVLAAAGNGHPAPLAFPARVPEVVAVGAFSPGGGLLPSTSRVPRLDVAAPGWGVAALVAPGRVGRRSGTSVACAVAGGVAALALASVSSAPARLTRERFLALITDERKTDDG